MFDSITPPGLHAKQRWERIAVRVRSVPLPAVVVVTSLAPADAVAMIATIVPNLVVEPAGSDAAPIRFRAATEFTRIDGRVAASAAGSNVHIGNSVTRLAVVFVLVLVIAAAILETEHRGRIALLVLFAAAMSLVALRIRANRLYRRLAQLLPE